MKALGETKREILQKCKTPTTWTELMKMTGVSKATLYQHIQELQKEGLLTQRKRKHLTTEKGIKKLDVLKGQEQVAYVNTTQNNVETYSLQAIIKKKRIYQAAFSMASSPREKLKLGFAFALFGKHWRRLDENKRRRIDRVVDSLSEGTHLAVYPKPIGKSEVETVALAAHQTVGLIIKNKSYKRKVAQQKKLTILLTIDLTELEEPAEVIDSVLYWAFT